MWRYFTLECLEKYGILIAVFLGSFFAALIAVYSVWKTNKNNIELERKKYNTEKEIRENLYCGILFCIYKELQIHDNIFENLKSEIEQFLQYFREHINVPVDNPFSEFPVDLMKVCRVKILDFDKFETETLSLISNYISLMDAVQNDLNLNRIRETHRRVSSKQVFIKGVEKYFEQINDTLEKLNGLRETIKKNIPEIIKSYPQSDVSSEISKDQNVEA
jgi:viroplasmin and RNaseH domain-containing protein